MSQQRNRIITIVAIVGFIGLLIWSTFGVQATECRVCVNYNGATNCAVASGPDETAAVETAQTTACGPLTNGMNDAIACGNRAPETRVCRTR